MDGFGISPLPTWEWEAGMFSLVRRLELAKLKWWEFWDADPLVPITTLEEDLLT